MPKTKQFNREEVLTQAMHVFWQQGYEATTMQDLIHSTGLKPGSLYDTFGNKHALFMAVIENYRRVVIDQSLEVLQAPGSSKKAIKNYLLLIQLKFAQAQRQFGCLMSNSTVELAVRDKQVAQVVSDHLHKLEENFRQVLERGIQQGELSSQSNVIALARFLTTCVVGLSVISKTPEANEYLTDSIEIIIATLR